MLKKQVLASSSSRSSAFPSNFSFFLVITLTSCFSINVLATLFAPIKPATELIGLCSSTSSISSSSTDFSLQMFKRDLLKEMSQSFEKDQGSLNSSYGKSKATWSILCSRRATQWQNQVVAGDLRIVYFYWPDLTVKLVNFLNRLC